MTDHTPTSLEQLRAILTALASPLPEATPLGRVLVDGQNGSAYAAICAEIAQTVRPRHLLFTGENQQQLAVIVRAGTVLRLTDPTSPTLSDLVPDLPNRDLHPDAKDDCDDLAGLIRKFCDRAAGITVKSTPIDSSDLPAGVGISLDVKAPCASTVPTETLTAFIRKADPVLTTYHARSGQQTIASKGPAATADEMEWALRLHQEIGDGSEGASRCIILADRQIPRGYLLLAAHGQELVHATFPEQALKDVLYQWQSRFPAETVPDNAA